MDKNCELPTKPKTFSELITSAYFWTPARGVIIGGILGYLYWHFEGCTSGACAITGNPFSSVIAGALLGLGFVTRPCRSC